MTVKRQRVEGGMSLQELLLIMAEGNTGAISVLMKMVQEHGDTGYMYMLSLNDMNIRGSQIWVGYKDHCKQDMADFIACIDKRDQAMVDTINAECYRPEMDRPEYQHRARVNRHAA